MRKLFGLFFLLIFFVNSSYAQENWGGGVDDEDVHFGFSFQYVNTNFKLVSNDPLNITSPLSSGFGLGYITDVRLGNHLNFRATPALVFVDRFINYENESPKKITVQSATLDLPIGFKLKSDRRRNFRAYVLGGVKYSIDIISKKKLLANSVKTNRNIVWYEAGIGFDFYFEFFKLSPEIKWSQTVNNVFAPPPPSSSNVYTAPLEKLLVRNFQFSLYFE
jgi:hypothetical protein